MVQFVIPHLTYMAISWHSCRFCIVWGSTAVLCDQFTCDTKEACFIGVLLINISELLSLAQCWQNSLWKNRRFCSCSYQWVESHWTFFKLRHKEDDSRWWKATYITMPQNLFFFQPTHCYQSASELFCMQMKPVWVLLVSCFPDKQYRNRHPLESGSTWLDIRITWELLKIPSYLRPMKSDSGSRARDQYFFKKFSGYSNIQARLTNTVLELEQFNKTAYYMHWSCRVP